MVTKIPCLPLNKIEGPERGLGGGIHQALGSAAQLRVGGHSGESALQGSEAEVRPELRCEVRGHGRLKHTPVHGPCLSSPAMPASPPSHEHFLPHTFRNNFLRSDS